MTTKINYLQTVKRSREKARLKIVLYIFHRTQLTVQFCMPFPEQSIPYCQSGYRKVHCLVEKLSKFTGFDILYGFHINNPLLNGACGHQTISISAH